MKINLHNLAASVRTLLGLTKTHIEDPTIHVTETEKTIWAQAANKTGELEVQVSDLSGLPAEVVELSTSVDQLFTSVSNGKTIVANAITQKGVTTATDAEFATMAGNIGKIITSTGNATAADVLTGKTFSNGSSTGLTGTMPSIAAKTWTPTTSAQTIPSGRYVAGQQTIAGDANLVPANIVLGKSIFGITGTAPPGRRFVSSTGTVQNYSILINVNALGYVPSILRVDFSEGTKIFYTPYLQYSPYITVSGSSGTFLTTYNSGIININCSYGEGTSFNYYAWE